MNGSMNRRSWFQLGTAVAAGGPAALAQISTEATWKPAVFDEHENETVVVLTELIIPATDTPGAKAALVNRWMDRLFTEAPAAQKDAFLEGLHWLDGYSIQQHGQAFVRLSAAQQTAILTTLDSGTAANVEPGRRFFRLAKRLTSSIYYATQIGQQELNKGGRVPAGFGCTHNHNG